MSTHQKSRFSNNFFSSFELSTRRAISQPNFFAELQFVERKVEIENVICNSHNYAEEIFTSLLIITHRQQL
jgi:hypothetical protein